MTTPIHHIVILGASLEALTVAHVLKKALRHNVHIEIADCFHDSCAAVSLLPPAAIGFFRGQGIPESLLINQQKGCFRSAKAYRAIKTLSQSKSQRNFYFPFTAPGFMLNARPFHQFAIWERKHVRPRHYDAYSLSAVAASKGRFRHPSSSDSSLFSSLSYGYSLNTAPLKSYLSQQLKEMGVEFIEGDFLSAHSNPESRIESIDIITNGSHKTLKGDFFVDCSGARGALISEQLNVSYLDASDYLPVNSGLRLTLATTGKLDPADSVEAIDFGWLLEAKSQSHHQIDMLFNSQVTRPEDALNLFSKSLNVNADAVEQYKITPGRREFFWYKNCLSLGLAAGDIQEFGLSSLALAQSAALRFVNLFPVNANSHQLAREYNRLTHIEYDHVTDFHALHYELFDVPKTPFWKHAKTRSVSTRLDYRLTTFAKTGRMPFYEGDPFSEDAWISLLLGADFWPENYDILIKNLNPKWILEQLDKMYGMTESASSSMPMLSEYLEFFRSNDNLH